MLDFTFDDQYGNTVLGVDEAGRGPLAGPVTAACAMFHDRALIPSLNDSKRLCAKKRSYLFQQIKKQAYVYVGHASVEEIDQINILEATKRAMHRAIEQCYQQFNAHPSMILIDGNQPLSLRSPSKTVIKGDQKSAAIAAASIIAKVTRDRIMAKIHQEYPAYGFLSHAGYGTKTHLAAIEKYGPSPIHRKSFKPLKCTIQQTT